MGWSGRSGAEPAGEASFAAIPENYQQEDGTVIIREALRPYMGGASHILPATR
jgi:seryl-tRNA synthetase